MRRILYLAQAEVLHILRDHILLAQVLVVPVVQLLILSNAATFEIRNTPIHVVDLDRSSASRGVVNRLAANGHFHIVDATPSTPRADERLVDGTATLAVVIPHDFETSLVRTGVGEVQLLVNAEKGSAAGIVQSYASQVLTEYAASLRGPNRVRAATDLPSTATELPSTAIDLQSTAGRTLLGPPPQIDVRVRPLYNATQNYKHYMVPGILVALMTMIGTLLSAQNIAREKELGTLEQLNVTPITRGEFIVAKLMPFWVLGLIELSLGLIVGKLVFGIPMRGSVPLLFGVAGVYLVVALGIGLWISALVDTQQQAMFVTFFIVNVYLLMSGLFTPVDSMAPWVQQVSIINPVRHFVTISRAILMKGAGLGEIAQPFLILIGTAAVVLFVAVRQYRKRAA
jgi:ABC-2 type transport system permease protein